MIIDSSNISQYINSNSSQKSNKNTKPIFKSNTEKTDVFDTVKKLDKSFS